MENVDISAMSRRELEQLAVENATTIKEQAMLLRYYKEELTLLRDKKYGRKGEGGLTDANQINLFNEAEALEESSVEEPTLLEVHPRRGTKKKKKKGAKEALLKPLPKESTTYTLTEEEAVCPVCGEPLHEMKTEIRRELEIIPASVQLKEFVTQVYACRHCEAEGTKGTIVCAPSPPPLLSHSLLSPSMAAFIIWRKYENRDPLNKISQDFERNGLQLSRQTLSNWMIHIAEDYGQLLYDRMKEKLLTYFMIHADETPVQVLREPGRTAFQQSYMWIFSSGTWDRPVVRLYCYAPSRSRAVAKNFLGEYQGYVQSDGYSVYRDLGPGITPVGCMIHCRRNYLDAVKVQPKGTVKKYSGAGKGLRYCNLLCELDRRRKELPEEKWAAYKEKRIRPMMESFFAWAEKESLAVPSKCKLAEALGYTLNQKQTFLNYLLDGRLEISNNAAERAVKPFALGRKNWMFCNTPKGAKASEVLYSLVETAKMNGLKPFDYLKWVLEEMRSGIYLTDSFLDSLLPWSERIPPNCKSPENETPPETV